MANVVKITSQKAATTDLIDFVSATSDYKLRQNGLGMPVPNAKRVEGSDSPRAEGSRILERQYANREIVLTFNIDAADHTALVADVRAIQDALDRALRAHKSNSGHEKIQFHYKLDNAVDEIVFDVLDGELSLGNISDPRTVRDAFLPDCELTLICEPFGRLNTPRRLRNLLINGGFDWNPRMQGMPGSQYIEINSVGERLELASASGLEGTGSPSPLAAGLYFYPDTATAGVLARCGDGTVSWQVEMLAGRQVKLTWYETDATTHILTSATAIALDKWHSVAFCIYSTDGTDVVTVLLVDDRVEATERVAVPTGAGMRTPVGAFTMGATVGDVSRIDGRLHGIYVITGQQILPFQLVYLNRFGFETLRSNGAIPAAYWGFDKTELALLCLFTETSGNMLDVSGNSRDLVPQGTTSRSDLSILPEAWTLGTAVLGKTGCKRVAPTNHGPFSVLFDVGAGEGSANYYIEQAVTLPAGETTATLVLWVKKLSGDGKIEIKWEGSTKTITLTDTNWHQYWWTLTGLTAGSSTTVRIQWSQSTATGVYCDSVALYPGLPFGSSTDLEERSTIVPYVGSSMMQNVPDLASNNNARVNWLDIIDVDGDVPATCRVLLRNPSADEYGPIRVGCGQGKNVWNNVLYWQMGLFAPIYADSSAYLGTYPDPSITTAAATTLVDRIAISLARLFPDIRHQHGSYQTYLIAEGEENMTSLLQLETSQAKIPLSQDPLKDDTTDTGKIVHDTGILAWPPNVGVSKVVDQLVSGRTRLKLDNDMTPRLVVSNIADAVVAAPNIAYHGLFLLPVDAFAVLRPASIVGDDGLQQNEVMVVDTLDEAGVSYILREIALADATARSEMVLMSSADLAVYSTGFELAVGAPMFFTAHAVQNMSHFPWGTLTLTNEFEMWIEYSPRFLFV